MDAEKINELRQALQSRKLEIRELQASLFEFNVKQKELEKDLEQKLALFHRDSEWLTMLEDVKAEEPTALPEDEVDHSQIVSPTEDNSP